MTINQTLAFTAFSIVAAITPGPSNFILTSIGASVGVRRGLPCLIGVAAGMGLLMFSVFYGLGTLVLESAVLLAILKWVGAGFLLWLAWKIATSHPDVGQRKTEAIGFRRAAALQWVNPKSWLVCASAAGTYLTTDGLSSFSRSASFAAIFVAVALPSCFIWLAFGAVIQRYLASDRTASVIRVTMAVVLASSILFIIR